MKNKNNVFKIIYLIAAALMYLGCAKKPSYKMEAEPSVPQMASLKRAKANYNRSEPNVSRLMDNPSALYMENEAVAQNSSGNFDKPNRNNPTNVNPGTREKRMIHYNGRVKHRTATPQKSMDSIVALAKKYEGYVESRRHHYLVIRVPVQNFQTVYDSILALGNIMENYISANDVTDSYQDNELRIKIAEKTIERLQEILKKTEKDEDKLKLLKEIQRISENLEQLESVRQSLKLMAEYSTIRIEVFEYHPKFGRHITNEFDGFHWINSLDPFKDSYDKHSKYFELKVPKEMVKLKTGNAIVHWLFGVKRQWKTTSADGVRFECRRIKNKPRGSSDFWRKAINQRLSPQFREVKEMEKGDFLLSGFTSHGVTPYTYMVGVKSNGKYLDVIEVYFPSQKQLDRYEKSVFNSIEEGPL